MTRRLPPHPVLAHPTVAKLRGPRDAVETPPEAPDADEAALMCGLLTGDVRSWESMQRADRARKLVLLRCQWFGWIDGRDWSRPGDLTETGTAVLRAYLEEGERNGDEALGRMRRRYFRTGAEEALRKHLVEEADAAVSRGYDLRNRMMDLDTEARRWQSRIEEAGMQLAKGANDVDGLVAEMRHCYVEMSRIKAEAAALDPAREAEFKASERLRGVAQRILVGEVVSADEARMGE